ncbi:MAG: AsmA-like C-terminal region-containing protein [Puniceicoccales bacterium]|jgi:hypothetical protein|nr:AsmA-like C-terminal region-containing protein [Puniceicoccales bacterium]
MAHFGISLVKVLGRGACKLLNIVLLMLLAIQLYLWWCLRNDFQLDVPQFIATFICECIEEEGIRFRPQKISFRPNGYLEFNSTEIGSPGNKPPVFIVRRVVATVSFPWLLCGRIVLKRALLDGGSFICPAAISPNGHQQTILDDIRAVVRGNADGKLCVETLQARFGQMPIVFSGEFIPPYLDDTLLSRGSDGATIGLGEWLALNTLGVRMLDVRTKLETWGKLSLDATGRGNKDGSITLSVRAHGYSLKLPLPGNATATDAVFSWSIRFDGKKFHPGQNSVLDVRSIRWEPGVPSETQPRALPSIQTGPLRITSRFLPNWEAPTHATISATGVAINDTHVDHLHAVVDWGQYPLIQADAHIVSRRDIAHLKARVNWGTRAATIAFDAQVTPALYLSHPQVRPLLPQRLASLVVHQGLALRGETTLEPGWKFSSTQFDFDIGALDFAGFSIANGRGKLSLSPQGFALTEADVRAPGYGARGSFSTRFSRNGIFRLLLNGRADPRLLGQFIGKFWTNIWKDFDFAPNELPRADIEVRGQWNVPYEFIYCGASGKNFIFRDVALDHAELRIMETPTRIALFDMLATQGTRPATGTIQLHYTPLPDYKRESIRFRFAGTMRKDDGARLAANSLPQLLTPLQVEGPVSASVSGLVHDVASKTPGRMQVALTANIPGKLTAWHLPFSDVKGNLIYDSGQLAITVETANFAGGRIGPKTSPWITERPERPQRAWIDLRPDNPLLTLDVEVLGARRTLFWESLKKLSLNADKSPKGASQPVAPMPATDAPDDSQLDLNFVGSISLPKLETLSGTGEFTLTDPSLPQLHIFGGLSRGLDKLGIGLTSFKFNHAQANFILQNTKIFFPKLTIGSVNGHIDSIGNYDIGTSALDFQARLTPNTANTVPIVGVIAERVNQLPKILQVKVNGHFDDPTWHFDLAPTAIFRETLDLKSGLPETPKQETIP